MSEKKLLFSATVRDIRFILENGYLNEKGIKWAKSFLDEEDLEGNKDE